MLCVTIVGSRLWRSCATVQRRYSGVTGKLVYFSSVSNNTDLFVEKLGLAADRLPVRASDRRRTVCRSHCLPLARRAGWCRSKSWEVLSKLPRAGPDQHRLFIPLNQGADFGGKSFGTLYAQSSQMPVAVAGSRV
jgi:hypothetical protein